MRWHMPLGVFVTAGMLGLAPTRAAPPAGPTADERVTKLYGELIETVQKTADEDDDLTVARQILVHALDTSASETLQLALAKASLRLTSPLHSKDAKALTKQGWDLIREAKGMEDLALTRFQLELAESKLKRLLATRAGAPERRAAAAEVVMACIRFIDQARTDAALAEDVEACLTRARTVAAQHRLTSDRDLMQRLMVLQRWIRGRQAAFTAAAARLEAAEKRQDDTAIKAAHLAMGRAHLEYDANLAEAGRHLTLAGDAAGEKLTRAAKYLADPTSVDASEALATTTTILKLLDDLEEPGKRKVGLQGLAIARQYQKDHPGGAEAGKAGLIALQIEKALGITPATKLFDRLARNYGGLHGKLAIKKGMHVQVGYDFSSSEQLRDFGGGKGQWRIAKGVLGGRAPAESYTSVTQKLRFRRDAPVRLSMLMSGRRHLQARLNFLAEAKGAENLYAVATLREAKTGDHTLRCTNAEGVRRSGEGFRWSLKHRVDLVWDGKATVTWYVNKKRMGSSPISLPAAGRYRTITCSVGACSSQVYVGDLLIEGTVDPDPYGKEALTLPPSPEPAAPKPPGPAPAKPEPAKPGGAEPAKPAGEATSPATPMPPLREPKGEDESSSAAGAAGPLS